MNVLKVLQEIQISQAEGLTNIELEKIAKKILGKNFLGVYPCDAFPKINKNKINNFSIIFNLSKHNEGGSHFVSILKIEENLFYFDSFGKKCDNKFVMIFLKSISDTYFFNGFEIQHPSSMFCGVYSLGFLISSQKFNIPIESFLNLFYFKNVINDQIIIDFIVKVLKVNKNK